MSSLFKFKQFNVNQEKCAMKIGTDAVLLGAWATLSKNPFAVLDIGAGTGILSLMMAQRTNAQQIEAIEIDDLAYEQCAENFENSPWNDRLFCYHASLLEFIEEVEEDYDIIVCNPPFYSENYKTNNKSRDLARFNDAMPFEHIMYAFSKFLSETGTANIIIPFKEEQHLIKLGKLYELHPNKILRIKGHENKEFKRSIITFSFNKTQQEIESLTVEKERHNYTEDYKKLTKDFYLNF